MLRLLPFAVWFWAQFAMAASGPVSPERAVGAQSSALAALAEILPGEQIVLCAVDGHGSGAHAPDNPSAHGHGCDWCQSFAHAVLPSANAAPWRRSAAVSQLPGMSNARLTSDTCQSGYQSRAPPV